MQYNFKLSCRVSACNFIKMDFFTSTCISSICIKVFDIKILSKALAKRLKQVLPCIISVQQTAYVQNKNIGESGRLISDIIKIANTLQTEGFLVTMDVEKAFDSLDHKFLISVLKKIGFGQNFVS